MFSTQGRRRSAAPYLGRGASRQEEKPFLVIPFRPGISSAFYEFVWRFVNIISHALVALGQRPDYARIACHVINIDELLIDYSRVFLPGHDRQVWDEVVRIASGISEKNTPRNLQRRGNYIVALEQYLSTTRLHDPVLDGL